VHSNKWLSVDVEIILEEMLKITYSDDKEPNNVVWLAKDAETLAPFRSMQGLQEQVEKENERIEAQEKLAAAANSGQIANTNSGDPTEQGYQNFNMNDSCNSDSSTEN